MCAKQRSSKECGKGSQEWGKNSAHSLITASVVLHSFRLVAKSFFRVSVRVGSSVWVSACFCLATASNNTFTWLWPKETKCRSVLFHAALRDQSETTWDWAATKAWQEGVNGRGSKVFFESIDRGLLRSRFPLHHEPCNCHSLGALCGLLDQNFLQQDLNGCKRPRFFTSVMCWVKWVKCFPLNEESTASNAKLLVQNCCGQSIFKLQPVHWGWHWH